MPQMTGDLLARGIPQTKVMPGIHRLFVIVIRDRQTAAGGDRLQILAEIHHLTHHRAAHLLQMTIVNT